MTGILAHVLLGAIALNLIGARFYDIAVRDLAMAVAASASRV